MRHDTLPAVRFTRRRFLTLTGLAAGGLLVTACGGASPTATPGTSSTSSSSSSAVSSSSSSDSAVSSTTSSATSTTAAAASSSAKPTATPARAALPATPAPASGTPAATKVTVKGEAPLLADLVKAGKLPPVAERASKNPEVVKPTERIGKYGGTWRMGSLGGSDAAFFGRTIGCTNMVRWNPEWTAVIPDVAAAVETSSDGKAFTFTLREGMKWSDGEPFGPDDIVFWHDDVLFNKELTPSPGNNPPKVEKVDDHTVRFSFPQPGGLYLEEMARPGQTDLLTYPAHYLKQFHKKYADPAKLEQLMKENNAESWVKLFQLKGASVPGTSYSAQWSNPDLPTLNPWKIVAPYGTGNRVSAERNPYFWKVDPDGNQLPYIDKVVFDVYQDLQPLVLKAANGEIDMQDRHLATNQNKPVFVDNQQKGQYHFYETVPDSSNTAGIYPNWNHKDPVMRQIIQNKDFRVGLSYAIDRPAIIQAVYVGQGEPYQVASRPESKYYDEEFAKQFTEHDPDKANQHLDKVLPQKDSEGFRLRPDGKRFTMIIEIASANTDQIDVMKLIQTQTKAVGLDIQSKVEDRSLLWTRKNAADVDGMIWTGDAGLYEELNPSRYFPQFDGSHFAVARAYWYAKPAHPPTPAEEPPDIVKKQMSLYDQVLATVDDKKRDDLMRQLLAIAKDQLYIIGTVLPSNGYGIVKNNFHNVPAKIFSSGSTYNNPGPTNPSQYFIE
ncbi:MAG: ABC transporter substrate-binding protein [Thermomicrobiales bacterium]